MPSLSFCPHSGFEPAILQSCKTTLCKNSSLLTPAHWHETGALITAHPNYIYNERNAQQYRAVQEKENCSRILLGRSLYKNMLTNKETPSRELGNKDGIRAVHKSQD